jgi:site-specific DNA recombinase
MPVAIYLRVSSEEQRLRASIDSQREFGLSYCSLHQLDLFQTYADDGIPGTVPLESRPQGKRLLEDAHQHKFDQLLVFKLDRIGRDVRLILNAVAELEQHGVAVRSLTEPFDASNPSGRLMLTLLSGFAAHERELIRERSLAGTHRLAPTGTWLGGVAPYGYRKEGQRSAARLAISQELIPGFSLSEAEVVRTIFQMCAGEQRSCQKIADYLNQLGLPCGPPAPPNPEPKQQQRPRAALWRPSQVRNLIVSRTYMGQHLFGKRRLRIVQ